MRSTSIGGTLFVNYVSHSERFPVGSAVSRFASSRSITGTFSTASRLATSSSYASHAERFPVNSTMSGRSFLSTIDRLCSTTISSTAFANHVIHTERFPVCSAVGRLSFVQAIARASSTAISITEFATQIFHSNLAVFVASNPNRQTRVIEASLIAADHTLTTLVPLAYTSEAVHVCAIIIDKRLHRPGLHTSFTFGNLDIIVKRG